MRAPRTLRRPDGSALQWGAWKDVTGRAAVRPVFRSTFLGWHVNRIYSVRLWKVPTRPEQLISEWSPEDDVVQVSIMRRDERPGHSWPDFQRIKDELVGPDRLAVEVYPPRDKVVDPSHIYYLWVLPVGFQLPFRLFDPSDPVGDEAAIVTTERSSTTPSFKKPEVLR